MLRALFVVGALWLVLGACSSSDEGTRDGVGPGSDTVAADGAADTQGKDGSDAATDAKADAGGDAAADSGTDPGAADPGTPDVPGLDGVSDLVGVPCETACGLGDVVGKVCAPNSHTFVNSAKVWIDAIGCDGQPVHIETLSGADGSYTLKHVPCGTWEIHIEKGSFTHYLQVAVETGKVTDVSSQGVKMCIGATAVKLCVITGDWDTIEETIDELGFQFELYELYNGEDWWGGEAYKLLSDLNKLESSCDILFVDCGAKHCDMVQSEPVITSNIKTFVQNGNSLYASDFAYCYSEYAFPTYVDFYGSDDEDCYMGSGSGPIQMDGNQKLDATVLDPDLIAYMGKSTFKANFGLGPLVAVDNAGLSLAHVQGFVPKFNAVQPFVMSYKPFGASGGKVVYTNFHNDEQVSTDMAAILDYMVFQL
jgi:hypothetical protein